MTKAIKFNVQGDRLIAASKKCTENLFVSKGWIFFHAYATLSSVSADLHCQIRYLYKIP